LAIGTSDAEPVWTAFLRKLARRGLRGVKLVISDAQEGIKAAASKVLCATRKRRRAGKLKNALLTSSEIGGAAFVQAGQHRRRRAFKPAVCASEARRTRVLWGASKNCSNAAVGV
jgi:transposase-like protein